MAQTNNPTKPEANFATSEEIGGLHQQFLALKKIIAVPIREAERLKQMDFAIPKGCVLLGPPGTGKKTLAKCFARKERILCYNIDYSIPLLQGVIKAAFTMAKAKKDSRQSIIMISNFVLGRDDVFSEFVNELNCLDTCATVKVIVTTTQPEVRDCALCGLKRLTVVDVPLPDRAALTEIWKIHTRNIKRVDVDSLTGLSLGMTGAEIAGCVGLAALTTLSDEREIEHDDIKKEVLAAQKLK